MANPSNWFNVWILQQLEAEGGEGHLFSSHYGAQAIFEPTLSNFKHVCAGLMNWMFLVQLLVWMMERDLGHVK